MGGVAVAFLHDPEEEEEQMDDPNAMQSLPPSISFGAGAYTENDSWFLGGGFRYLMARRYGMRVGMDIATGPEDTVVYLAVGSNWN